MILLSIVLFFLVKNLRMSKLQFMINFIKHIKIKKLFTSKLSQEWKIKKYLEKIKSKLKNKKMTKNNF